MLALLLSSTLLLAPASTLGPALSDDPRTSFLEIWDGVGGGAIPARTTRRLLVGYDWNRQEFRALQWDRGTLLPAAEATYPYETTGEQFTVSVLTAQEFGALMDGIVERGLVSLPLEDPVGGEDIYHRNTTITFRHGAASWENRVPGGCEHAPSKRQPTPAQQEAFGQILAHAWEGASNATMRPGSPVDGYSIPTPRNRGELELLVVAAQALVADPAARMLDLNRPQFTELPRGSSTRNTETGRIEFGHWSGALSFPWRWDQPARTLGNDPRYFTTPGAGWIVIVKGEPSPLTIHPPSSAQLEDQRRRAALAQEQTGLTHAERSQIQAGWVLPGCSDQVALAVWGEPESRRENRWTYQRSGRSVTVRVTLSASAAGD